MRLSRSLAPCASLARLGSARLGSAMPSLVHTRALSSSAATFDIASWTEKWLDAVKDVPKATDPAQSADVLRQLVRTNLLSFTDMRDAPEKFFLAHRLLATVGLGGFGVRFTVQFNLFAGSIVGLGGPEQVESLKSIQQAGQLGCFLLTEMQAGVLSGLIVETTCDWDPATGAFVLHTPSDKAAKNWISQGYTAELGVVIADLRIGGKSHGPHAFMMQMRDEAGALLPGIRVEDMGTKTVANDLDNARVWFDQVRLPKGALLNRFADIADDKYVQTTAERMRIEVIGQRLLTGRLAIAEAAISSCRVLHMRTEEYARQKARLTSPSYLGMHSHAWACVPTFPCTLCSPCLSAAGVQRHRGRGDAVGDAAAARRLRRVVRRPRRDGLLHRRRRVAPQRVPPLQHHPRRRPGRRNRRREDPMHRRRPRTRARAAQGGATRRMHTLACPRKHRAAMHACAAGSMRRRHAPDPASSLARQVGSYALMHATGFELVDMLLCCKFAEGDSRILQQKLTRDRLKRLQRGGVRGMASALLSSDLRNETVAAISLARKLQPAGRDAQKLGKAMDDNWRQVYDLADMIAARHVRTGARGAFVEGATVERLLPAATHFDGAWKEKLAAPGDDASPMAHEMETAAAGAAAPRAAAAA